MSEADKYIGFRIKQVKPKTLVHEVFSKDNDETIGVVKWYPPWRHYCFFPCADTVFSDRCMLRIGEFVKSANEAHEEARRKR